jgi:FkbM family methyltransferase
MFGEKEGRSGAPRRAVTAADDSTYEELHEQKVRFELAMRREPLNGSMRGAYFDVLHAISASRLGLCTANLPEIRTPVFFRGGSSDLGNLREIFLDRWRGDAPFAFGDYGFQMPVPRRVLDLGAYCGYTALYFANRFPEASILAIEPPGANFDLLRANTAAYANIACRAVAVWHEPTRLTAAEHLLGDWGQRFEPGADDGLAALTVDQILAFHGWDGVDLVKCILEGEQVDVLATGERRWLDGVQVVVTKPTPAGQFLRAGDADRLAAGFATETFEHGLHQGVYAFIRHTARQAAERRAPTTVPLVPDLPLARPCTVTDAHPWFGCYTIGRNTVVLSPGETGKASLVVALDLSGQTRAELRAEVETAETMGSATLSVAVRDEENDIVVGEAEQDLAPGEACTVSFRLPPCTGPHELAIRVRAKGVQRSAVRILDLAFT